MTFHALAAAIVSDHARILTAFFMLSIYVVATVTGDQVYNAVVVRGSV